MHDLKRVPKKYVCFDIVPVLDGFAVLEQIQIFERRKIFQYTMGVFELQFCKCCFSLCDELLSLSLSPVFKVQ